LGRGIKHGNATYRKHVALIAQIVAHAAGESILCREVGDAALPK